MALFYVEDADGRVRGKFDGTDVDIPDDWSRVEVETLTDLESAQVDDWDNSLL